MTPKEKAEEIFDKIMDCLPAFIEEFDNSKYYINTTKHISKLMIEQIKLSLPFEYKFTESMLVYWDEVEKEIEKL